MINYIIQIISLIILIVVQVSFLTTWPWPVNSLNLILSLAIFLTVIINYSKGLYFVVGAGLLLELYSSLPFGTTTLSLLITVIAVNLLFSNFFTNRSFYSLIILGLIGTYIYNLLILSLNFLGLIVGLSNSFLSLNFGTRFFWQPLFNLLILGIIFFSYNISTGRLKNIFLFPTHDYETKR